MTPANTCLFYKQQHQHIRYLLFMIKSHFFQVIYERNVNVCLKVKD